MNFPNDFAITNGEDYPRCDPTIYRKGQTVEVSPYGKDITESICVELRKRGYKVDWMWYRNRAHVKTTDDVDQVREEWFKLLED